MEVPSFEFLPFEYSALPSPSHIRVLSLLSGLRTINDPQICGSPLIQCTLETINLDDKPDYDALSYCWGSPFQEASSKSVEYSINKKWPIAVNGRLLYVGKNLFEALSHFKPNTDPDPSVDKRYPPYNKTALIDAAERNRIEEVGHLLLRGADIKSADMFGETALHYAAENGHFEVVKILVQAGASLDVRDSSGRTPLICSEQRKRQEVAEFLRRPQKFLEITSSRKHAVKSRDIWIDAICINQNDITERNAQVAIMSQIYSTASTVLVWLGIKDEYTDLAEETMNILNSANQGLDGLWFDATWRYSQAQSNPNHDLDEDFRSDTSIVSIRQLRALTQLLRRTWFTRVWIIQEITLAKNIELFCGSTKFKWNDFFELVQHRLGKAAYHKALSESQSPAIKFGRGQHGTEAWTITDLRLRTRPNDFERAHIKLLNNLQVEAVPTWRSQMSLPVLLVFTWNFRATDPRDMIFALLNIAKPDEATANIKADYAHPTEDLYTDIARQFISVSGNDIIQDWQSGEIETLEPLEGLSFIQENLDKSKKRLPMLPSWVPDFSIPLTTTRIWNERFNCAGGTPLQIRPTEDKRTLSLHGFSFDTISDLEVKPEELPIGHSISYNMIGWLNLISEMNDTYPSGCSRVDALWRTLILNHVWDTNPLGEIDVQDSFRDFMTDDISRLLPESSNTALQLIEKLKPVDTNNLLPLREDIDRWRKDHAHGGSKHICKPNAPQMGEKRNFHSSFMQNYRTRRLFRTKKGYLGLGPRSASEGDEVVLLAGGRTPYVAKRVIKSRIEHGSEDDLRYSLVGECYVDGVMKGELTQGREDGLGIINLV